MGPAGPGSPREPPASPGQFSGNPDGPRDAEVGGLPWGTVCDDASPITQAGFAGVV